MGALVAPGFLETLVGPVREITEAPLISVGFSGSKHARLRVAAGDGTEASFVLKRIVPAEDWTCSWNGRTDSREANLLGSEVLDDVWEIFHCPYLGYGVEEGEVGLLMEDLTPFLFPDARVPLEEAAETQLIGALADLHARFWNDESAALPWLSTPADYLDLLGPERVLGVWESGRPPGQLAGAIVSGWEEVLRRVPAPVAEIMRSPGSDLVRFWRGLPHTVVHGDAKVANFARLPNGRLAAFDWAMMGWAPPSVDLGWYLAVNATRLARPKDELLALYRRILEDRIAYEFAQPVWERLERHAVLMGARALLWSKANALVAGREGAEAEWSWWVDRLVALAD